MSSWRFVCSNFCSCLQWICWIRISWRGCVGIGRQEGNKILWWMTSKQGISAFIICNSIWKDQICQFGIYRIHNSSVDWFFFQLALIFTELFYCIFLSFKPKIKSIWIFHIVRVSPFRNAIIKGKEVCTDGISLNDSRTADTWCER